MYLIKELVIIAAAFILNDHDWGYCPAHIMKTEFCGKEAKKANKKFTAYNTNPNNVNYEMTRKYCHAFTGCGKNVTLYY